MDRRVARGRLEPAHDTQHPADTEHELTIRFLAAFGRFWWDFVVGDDWRIAAGVLTALAAGALMAATRAASDGVISTVVIAGIVAAFVAALLGSAGPG